MEPQDTEPKPSPIGPIVAAIVTAIGGVIIAYVQFVAAPERLMHATQTAQAQLTVVQTATLVPNTPTYLPATTVPTGTPMSVSTSTLPLVPTVAQGRLEGVLTDRTGKPISDMVVSILSGPEAKTDINGKFVFGNVPAGDRVIIVRPPSGDGQFTLNVSVAENLSNQANIVYDAATSRLGLLSVTSPVDGGELEVRQDQGDSQGTPVIVHRATIFGRCDGLAQIFTNGFDVWVLISSERDGKYWVQFPAATIDPHNNTWRANVVLGDVAHPPLPGEKWTIVAAAAYPDAGFDRILNTPKLSLLPPHVGSNVATVETMIK